MSLLDPIDIYCERTGPGIFAEPLGAASNIAFFIAACALWQLYKQQGKVDRPALALIALITAIGAGSLSFHLFANGLTLLADVIPITLLILTYLWFALRRMIGLSRIISAGWLVVYLAVSSAVPPQYFNGSASYFPVAAALLLLAAGLLRKAPGSAKMLALTAFSLIVSLFFRTVDIAWCDSLPHGTHAIWHCINGVVLYLAVRSLMLFPRER